MFAASAAARRKAAPGSRGPRNSSVTTTPGAGSHAATSSTGLVRPGPDPEKIIPESS